MTEHTTVKTSAVLLHAEDVEELPWREVPGWEAAVDRVFWSDHASGSNAGLLSLAPGAHHPRHEHAHAAHHIYVLGGSLRIGDETLVRGGYAHIPGGVDHGPDTAGPEGCTLFYVYEAG